jgi:hypothetical protein
MTSPSAKLCSLAFILGVACTPPPPLITGETPFRSVLSSSTSFSTVIAGGDAVICINGDAHHGNVDMASGAAGTFAATFYGPLGIIIASVTADSLQGTVILDNGRYTFRRDRTMDTLPFAWGRDLTFDDLTELVAGKTPASVRAITAGPPDSIGFKKKTINTRWKTDILEVYADVRKKTNNIERLTVKGINKKQWSLTLSSFRDGMAYKIGLKEDDTNYFSINYRKVRFR